MSICFYPFKDTKKISLKKKDQYRIIDTITISSHIPKITLDNIFNKILIECKFSVIGYDRDNDKYYCKKYIKSKCEQYFEIEIITNDLMSSTIKILPLIGTNISIKNFVTDLKIILQRYESFQKTN